jgi:hypothetical protein
LDNLEDVIERRKAFAYLFDLGFLSLIYRPEYEVVTPVIPVHSLSTMLLRKIRIEIIDTDFDTLSGMGNLSFQNIVCKPEYLWPWHELHYKKIVFSMHQVRSMILPSTKWHQESMSMQDSTTIAVNSSTCIITC